MSDEVTNNDVPVVPVVPVVSEEEETTTPPVEITAPPVPPADAMPEVEPADVVDTPADTTAPAAN
jgi:hypothetical protein